MKIPFTQFEIKRSIKTTKDTDSDLTPDSMKKLDAVVKTNFWIPFFISVVVVFVFFAYYWLYLADPGRGTFGDSFGPLTALFTGLAFAGVIATLWVQRQDIKVTQEEMRKSVKAQQDMATKMEQEISFARLTSNLELFHKYITIVEKGSQTTLGDISRRIVANLTHELIKDPIFRYAVTPKIDISKSQRTKYITGPGYEFTLSIVAEKFSIKVKTVEFDPKPENETVINDLVNQSIPQGGSKEINILLKSKTFKLRITIQDEMIGNYWIQEYDVNWDAITPLGSLKPG